MKQPEQSSTTAPEQSADVSRSPRDGAAAPWIDPPRTLLLAALAGLAFGFLLQKGGVAKFDILIGALLLEDFTVVKVMASAIVVGMIGVLLLRRFGRINLHIKPTVLGRNIAGGLLFGVGFGTLAYCPGTDAAAVGQGNLDAITGIAGMLCGSYLYALTSHTAPLAVFDRGRLGEIRLTDVTRWPEWLATAACAALLVAALIVVEILD
ncbi:MAG: YeeE/YedE family protein [Phycisphaerales bacterium]|nr:YeeE/YedE family protein [Phycisphaerales bacterium]